MKALIGYVMMLVLLLSPVKIWSAEGFSGTIYFRDGTSVKFNHLGDLKHVYRYWIEGKLGMQDVLYDFTDVSEIIFAEANVVYCSGHEGTVIVINKSGERFTLKNVTVECAGSSKCFACKRIYYVYNDPITKSLKNSGAWPGKVIGRISIGKDVGDLKYNPNTKEYFPPFYNYDPYTGEKLIWAHRK